MNSLPYRKIDAFVSGNSLGNPAACIFIKDGESLTDTQMQNIAYEHRGFVSEVVFCKQTQDGFALRYFSSQREVDFCGHGTIACMYTLLSENSELAINPELVINTKNDTLTVCNKLKEQDAVFITAPKMQQLIQNIPVCEIVSALEILSEDLDNRCAIDFINAGLNTLIVPIINLKTEISIFPNESNLRDFCLKNNIDIILIFSMEVKDNHNIAHSRVFAPKFGYLEDPATGSGNSAFGYYMLKNNLWKGEDISIEQGGNDRTSNIVKLCHCDSVILFGGKAKTKICGEYFY